uniref:Uncharacterized protein n=1 Tax=Crocodylus porosus TaxID=8502 RepID=A0A7M4EDG4_CROPO
GGASSRVPRWPGLHPPVAHGAPAPLHPGFTLSCVSPFQKLNISFFLSPSPVDGVFGRCQRVPVIDIYKYEVSPPILQRLRIILEKLSQRGTVKRGVGKKKNRSLQGCEIEATVLGAGNI